MKDRTSVSVHAPFVVCPRTKSRRPVASGFVLLICMLGPVAANAQGGPNTPTCHPMYNGTVVINGASYPLSPTRADIPDTVHMLGSPSGLAHNNGLGIPISLLDSEGHPLTNFTHEITIYGDQELWITGGFIGSKPIMLNGNSENPLECDDPHTSASDLPYLQKVVDGSDSYTFYPSFGGIDGPVVEVRFQMKICGSGDISGYQPIFNMRVRSTDIEGDGDTDEADEAALRAAMTSQDLTFDLDWSGTVDSADLAIMMLEARRRVMAGHCDGGSEPVSYNSANYVAYLPATVTDLTVTRLNPSTARLKWTASADDGSTGRAAYAYDIRRSASPITSLSAFGYANPIGTPPTPGSPGTIDSMDVAWSAGTRLYCALRVEDDAGNWSDVSNSAQEPDLAPARVTNLGISTGRYMAALHWTSPGEDSVYGTATDYDIRYATTPITASNFASANQLTSNYPSPPHIAGTTECALIDPLNSCESLYVALKTRDAAGNWSALSNVAKGKTKCTGSLSYDCGGSAMRRTTDERPAVALGLGRFSPNPTQAGGTIGFSVPADFAGEPFELTVFDVTGRRLRSIASGAAVAGFNRATWDLSTESGERARPGLYLVRMQIGETRFSREVIVRP